MSSTFMKNIKITIFGASHSELLGATIDPVAPGIKIDFDYINKELSRRKGGQLSSSRREGDLVRVVSGEFNGFTTGAPLTFTIENKDIDSSKYEKMKATPRPSHADYANYVKSMGYNDYRGGGTTSGRLTAIFVTVGAFFKKILESKGIIIKSHITKIGKMIDKDASFDLLDEDFPVSNEMKEEFLDYIKEVSLENDSLGGEIQIMAQNVDAGIGEPFFDSIESTVSSLMFSVPSVKGVSFGLGESFAISLGSEVSDEFYYDKEKVKTKTNYNGGINGGITNGMPIIVNVTVKPTPSIKREFDTINLETKENAKVNIDGRFDPCILLKMPPIVEAALAISIVDQYVGRYGYLWMK